MTEPTYHYVKGQGWVPSTADFCVGTCGQWRITLIRRLPLKGEYFFTSYSPLIETMKALIEGDDDDYWPRVFRVFLGEEAINKIPVWGCYSHMQDAYDRSPDYFMTCELERL